MNRRVKIGVFGGSGFYNLLEKAKEIDIETSYGKPSDKITIGEYKGKQVAFLPRHGKEHQYPPHRIPYRANLAAFKELGVEYVIGPCAAGSLQPRIKPGDFVILDQFVDRTWGREDTIFNGPKGQVAHFAMSDPYCPALREIASRSCDELKIPFHKNGTAVVIQGPRFSTKSESRWFASQGWETINMTQYPECYLAREMGMCYVGIALITDYDVGVEGREDIKPVTMEEVIKTFNSNNEKVKDLIFKIIEKLPPEKLICGCQDALKNALI
ncbi:MAG TPA: S-methyl-5'-thioadenosine phosphorylase [Candidatus Paceibacterota bacterium]